MEGFTDIHCHILPGLDDGAGSMEEARQMLAMASAEGIREIIATPHNYGSRRSVSPETIRASVGQMQQKLREWDLPVRLYPGNEIYYRSEVPELLEEGKICTLAGSRYVLVEFDPMTEYAYLRDGILKLDSFGYVPILAHVERYECLFEKKERLQRIKDHGACFQSNASSFQEGIFSTLGKRSRYLLKNGLLDLLGTDAHSRGKRSPRIRETAALVEKKAGPEEARRILYDHPRAILAGERFT